ncbi:MAG: 1-deoxy-D-xylulose-5-phosphate reductoisomerase [Acidobacteria bacterium]|nr:1-deoxy-D-xylulose-5-phosphate reductoisomerase [Acidobacteriota bacterium]
MKGLCILGSTGSVGQNTLRVVRSLPGRFRVVALCAGKNLDLLADQIQEFVPLVASVATEACIEPLRQQLRARNYSRPVKIVAGTDGQVEASTHPEVSFVVSASHGVTGLVATYEAVRAGKNVGLANKETLVVAGEVVTRAARERSAEVLPIDSEHSALHQCLRSGRPREVGRLILTGSGGPFLKTPRDEFENLTPEQALKHPVWKMGERITIDSATLMNKGLEIIEAHWLFGLPSDRIDVLIHPESIVHSMIEFVDGSVVAQMSVADMRLPIQYALTFPERVALNGSPLGLDLVAIGRLHFEKPDSARFPCLDLARVALERGGALPCALNAGDEVAVEAFLAGRLRFPDIPRAIERVMELTPEVHFNSLTDVLECDGDARRRAAEVVAEIGAAGE